jgi:hypothetical protein
MKQCKGAIWDDVKKYYIMPFNLEVIQRLMEVFSLKNDTKLNNLCSKLLQEEQYFDDVVRYQLFLRRNPNVPIPVQGVKVKTDMRRYQEIAFYVCISIKKVGLFLKPGTGKSKVIIDTIVHRMMHSGVKRVLIVCLRYTIHNTWVKEVKKHSDLMNIVRVIEGSVNEKISLLDDKRDSFIHIMTFDCVRGYEEYLKAYDMVVFDESRRAFACHTSKRTKAAVRVAMGTEYVILSTGTPNTKKDFMDIFAQYLVMDYGFSFGLSYKRFMNKYFKNIGRKFPMWVVRDGSLEQISHVIYRRAVEFTKEECLDLPSMVFEDVMVPLSYDQKVMTDMIVSPCSKNERFIELTENYGVDCVEECCRLKDAIPLAKIIKSQEITSGFYIPFSDDRKVITFDSNKIGALSDLLEILEGEKVVIWVRFNHDIDIISEVLRKNGVRYAVLSGSVDQSEKWRNNRDITVLLGNEALGIGLPLVEAHYVVYYSYNYSLEQWQQSVDRTHRIGQEHNVCNYVIKGMESIDEAIHASLERNKDISQKLTEARFAKYVRGVYEKKYVKN